jgi:hypothetical protein
MGLFLRPSTVGRLVPRRKFERKILLFSKRGPGRGKAATGAAARWRPLKPRVAVRCTVYHGALAILHFIYHLSFRSEAGVCVA